MASNRMWMQTILAFVAMLSGAVIGAMMTLAHVGAAPLEAPVNVAQGSGIFTARYLQDTVAAFTLRRETDQAVNEPILIMTGRLRVQFNQPTGADTDEQDFFGFMYVNEEDLASFPGPMVMANREDDIVCHAIDTIDTEEGLATLRRAFEEAYGRPPNTE